MKRGGIDVIMAFSTLLYALASAQHSPIATPAIIVAIVWFVFVCITAAGGREA